MRQNKRSIHESTLRRMGESGRKNQREDEGILPYGCISVMGVNVGVDAFIDPKISVR